MLTASLISQLLLVSSASARFDQQNPPLQQTLEKLVGGTTAGYIPYVLNEFTDPCVKLTYADSLVTAFPGNAAVLEAAKDVVALESNFNTWVKPALPSFCNNATLPMTPELRGILAVVSDEGTSVPFGYTSGIDASAINALATASRSKPLDSTGKSVAALYWQLGFRDFVQKDEVETNTVLNVTAGVVTYAGTGCPTNSAGKIFSVDNSSLTVIFDSFAAYTGPGVDVQLARAECSINAQLRIPEGYQVSIATVIIRGFTQLPVNGVAKQTLQYDFTSVRAPAATEEKIILGPSTSIFGDPFMQVTDVPQSQAVWSQCSNTVPLRIKAGISVSVPSGQSGVIIDESMDTKVKQVFGLEFRRCQFP